MHISQNTSESSIQNLHRMHSDFTFLWYIVLGLLFPDTVDSVVKVKNQKKEIVGSSLGPIYCCGVISIAKFTKNTSC